MLPQPQIEQLATAWIEGVWGQQRGEPVQTTIYFPAESAQASVRLERHPSNSLTIGDVRLVFEDDRQLAEVLRRLVREAERKGFLEALTT